MCPGFLLQAPPDALCSTGLERACESEFERGFGGNHELQVILMVPLYITRDVTVQHP